MQLVGFWKILVNKFWKRFSFAFFHVHVVWWIKPYYLYLSYFLWRCKILLISKISTENTFKDRLYKHRNSLKLGSKANSTELPKHFWDIKREAIKKLVMHWSVIDHAKTYQNGSKRCNFCLTEKYHILTSPVNIINKRSELVSKCRHENKFQLINYKAIPPAN